MHPEADGKPCVIGNCQAGWAVMMLAAIRPELFGPIIIAGSPLSYWAGVRGKNPMRYSGGLLGGSWLTAFASDLGHGKFDGAWLVQNFENQNPANTLWTKQYNLYSKIDTEAPRYLGFERWWGGHVNLNAEEIQFIVDELFIGNNLAAGQIQTSDGTAIDLRNIRSPIVVFCSKGDNITPPQQALGWILDLYENVDEIRSYGQTIVYTIHESVGHLGIFVSGGVAKKEHGEFSSNIDLIDTLPPGLYEAVFEAKAEDTANPDLVAGNWVMRCEAQDPGRHPRARRQRRGRRAPLRDRRPRIRDQPRALPHVCAAHGSRAGQLPDGGMDAAAASAAAAIRALLQCQPDDGCRSPPWPSRFARTESPSAADNPFVAMQENVSRQIVAALDAWRDVSEALAERTFLAVYGLPALQAAVGIDPAATRPLRKAAKSPLHRELLQNRIAELKSRIPVGGRARSRHPRAPLCRHGAGCGRRARLRGRAPHSPGARRHAVVGSSRRWCASNSTCC